MCSHRTTRARASVSPHQACRQSVFSQAVHHKEDILQASVGSLPYSASVCFFTSVRSKHHAAQNEWDAIAERIRMSGESGAPLHLKIRAYHVDIARDDTQRPGLKLDDIGSIVVPRQSYPARNAWPPTSFRRASHRVNPASRRVNRVSQYVPPVLLAKPARRFAPSVHAMLAPK